MNILKTETQNNKRIEQNIEKKEINGLVVCI
jgi:hypothetical protein